MEETEEKGGVERRSPAPGAHEPSRGEMAMDSVHHGPCFGSMDRELGSTVSHAHAHSQEMKPSKSPTTPHGRAIARHVSRSARPRPAQIQPYPTPRPHRCNHHGTGRLFPTSIGCLSRCGSSPVSTSPAGARRGRNTGEGGELSSAALHPVHMSQAETEGRWTWSTMDPALGPWTVNLGSP